MLYMHIHDLLFTLTCIISYFHIVHEFLYLKGLILTYFDSFIYLDTTNMQSGKIQIQPYGAPDIWMQCLPEKQCLSIPSNY